MLICFISHVVQQLTPNDWSQGEQSLTDLLYTAVAKQMEKTLIPVTTSGHLQLHAVITCNSGQHFMGNSELFSV